MFESSAVKNYSLYSKSLKIEHNVHHQPQTSKTTDCPEVFSNRPPQQKEDF